MRKLLVAGVVLACGWLAFSVATTAEEEKPKATIKQVMKAAMAKGKLKDKVVEGTATAEEKKKLIECLEALAAGKPPKGDEAAWKEKTAVLLAAAKDCEAGKEGAGAALGKAANCAACHKDHKGG